MTRAAGAAAGLALMAVAAVVPRVGHAQFAYRPAGELPSGSGRGRVDATVYAPGIRFPIEVAPAFLNSQVYGRGGGMGSGGGQCDTQNYSYPWRDNYCETRSWDMPMCPAGQGHQGQDMRPSTCMNNVHWVVAVADGKITNIGSYSVYLTTADGTRFDYLHMGSVAVKVGDEIKAGHRVGKVSNAFGGTPTTIHLHFNIRKNVTGFGSVYAPTYMSLIRAYEALIAKPAADGGAGDGLGGSDTSGSGDGGGVSDDAASSADASDAVGSDATGGGVSGDVPLPTSDSGAAGGDASASPGSDGSRDGTTATGDNGCGCSAGAPGRSPPTLVLGCLAAMGFVARRRRRV